jgi:hypothetical protein
MNLLVRKVNHAAGEMDSFIGHAMKLSPNLVLLLDPEANIKEIAGIIYKWADKLNWMKYTCSVSV